MIFVGYRTKANAPVTVAHIDCPSCGGRALRLYAFFKYAHVYWIPMFPYSKDLVMHCAGCDKAWKHQDPDAGTEIGWFITEARDRTSPPWYLFAGSILLGIFLLAVLLSKLGG